MLSHLRHCFYHSSKFSDFLSRVTVWFHHYFNAVATAIFLQETQESLLKLWYYQGVARFTDALQEFAFKQNANNSPYMTKQGYHHYIIIPFVWQDQNLGMLIALNISEGQSSQYLSDLLTCQNIQKAICFLSEKIHQGMVSSSIRTQHLRWKLLEQFMIELSTIKNRTQLACKAVEIIYNLLPCHQIWIGFLEKNWLHIEFGRGISEDFLESRIHIHHFRILSQVIQEQCCVGPLLPILPHHHTNQNYKNPKAIQTNRNFLMIPILSPKFVACCQHPCWQTCGVIYIKNPLAQILLNFREQEWLSIVADQIGLTIRNQELYEEATIDFLTGTYRRGYFLELLENAITEQKMPQSLLMVDIDFFKLVNDTYGHPIGDALLQQLAELLHQTISPQDILGRFGGEEFIILLSHCTLQEAQIQAEQIRLRVARNHFGYSQKIIALTVSIGVAPYAMGRTLSQWLFYVDTALYQAKNSGRNCVCCAENHFV